MTVEFMVLEIIVMMEFKSSSGIYGIRAIGLVESFRGTKAE